MHAIWFHKRRADEGFGYGIANRGGLIVTAAFIILTATISVLPRLFGFTSAFATVAGIAMIIPAILGFLVIVRRYCDDQA